MITSKKTFRTITMRLSDDEHQKLKKCSEKHGGSVNNFLKKAIAMDFNFKTKNISNANHFLSTAVPSFTASKADKVILQAVLEMLYIMRDKEAEEMLAKAREFAKNKTNELVGD